MSQPHFGAVTPILRMFDVDKAKAFYVDYLGFQVDWQHRFEDGLPLYLQVSTGSCTLHLSEHHGDGSPGAALRVAVEDVDALHAALAAKDYPFLRPTVEDAPWGGREMTLVDPFGNRLTFYRGA